MLELAGNPSKDKAFYLELTPGGLSAGGGHTTYEYKASGIFLLVCGLDPGARGPLPFQVELSIRARSDRLVSPSN